MNIIAHLFFLTCTRFFLEQIKFLEEAGETDYVVRRLKQLFVLGGGAIVEFGAFLNSTTEDPVSFIIARTTDDTVTPVLARVNCQKQTLVR